MDQGPNNLARLRELLRKGEFFASLDDAAMGILESYMRPVCYRADAVICQDGERGDWTFIVAEGEVAVIKAAKDGTLIQVTTLGPGDWGGMMSLFEHAPRSAKLEARTNVELWMLDHVALEQLLTTIPGLAMGLLGFMSRRLRVDAVHLAATLRYVNVAGLEEIYEQCSPPERLILDTINHRVAAAESLDEIMNFLFESVTQIGDCDRMTLAFVEDDGNRVVTHWTRSTYDTVLLPLGFTQALEGGALQQVIASGQPRVVDDLVEYLQERPESRPTQLLVGEGLRSSMTCPLVVEGRTVGMLFRGSCRRKAFDQHQVRLHLAIAESISQAVEKAYRIEQLTEANRAYSEVLGFVSHELKSPIASMVTDARLLCGGYLGQLNDAQRSKIQRTIAKGEYLLHLVDDYLNLDQIESGAMKGRFRKDVDFIKEVAEFSIEQFEPMIEDKRMTLESQLAPLPPIECDAGLMKIVVDNLLGNAVKYGREGGTIRITIELDGDMLQIVVWNEGPGFPKELRANLFRKFSRLGVPELKKEKGTGVGLYSSWRVVRVHGGRITADSKYGQWAQFTVHIPLTQAHDRESAAQEETEGA